MGTPAVKLGTAREGSASQSVEERPVSPGVDILLGALHRTAGNYAVGRLLDAFAGKPPAEPGLPLDEATRTEMEARFGEDFGGVRLHTGGAAAATARDAGAEAFTTGNDITFAPGRYGVDSRSDRRLLAHELAHVMQQRRGGAQPTPGTNGAPEQEAKAAARNYTAGTDSLSVSASTGTGMACSVEDWFEGTPGIWSWGYTKLENERNELREWLDRQIVGGTEQVVLIEDAIVMIEAQMAKLEKGVVGEPKKRSKKRGGKRAEKAPAEDATAGLRDLPPPRCLMQQGTTQLEDPEEIREEFDLIVAWLQRKDVPDDDRRILQTQLQNMAPLIGQDLQQRATERRQAVVTRALTPTGAGDARARIREAVSLIDGIKPVAGRDDQYYLMYNDEMILFTKEEVQGIRAATAQALTAAAHKVQAMDRDALNSLGAQADVDRENAFEGWGVSLFTEQTTWEALDEFDRISAGADSALSRFHAAKHRGDLMTMAEELANAEEAAIRGKLFVAAHLEDIQTSGEELKTNLEITTAVAFTIVMIGTAGQAAPLVGGFVAGAGFTGGTATALTIGGTATVVGAEGFALGYGSGVTGELATGRSWSEAHAAGWEQGKTHGETGLKIGASAAAAPLVAARFGVGAPGVGTTGNVLRSGAAGATTNVGVEAGSRALLHQKLLSPEEAASAAVTGFVGGSTGRLTQKIKNPKLRGATNVTAGATTSGAIEYAQTGDIDKASKAAAQGGAIALGTGKVPKPGGKLPERAFEAGKRAREAARSGKRKAARTLGAGMLGVQTSGAVPRMPSGSSTAAVTNAPARTTAAEPRAKPESSGMELDRGSDSSWRGRAPSTATPPKPAAPVPKADASSDRTGATPIGAGKRYPKSEATKRNEANLARQRSEQKGTKTDLPSASKGTDTPPTEPQTQVVPKPQPKVEALPQQEQIAAGQTHGSGQGDVPPKPTLSVVRDTDTPSGNAPGLRTVGGGDTTVAVAGSGKKAVPSPTGAPSKQNGPAATGESSKTPVDKKGARPAADSAKPPVKKEPPPKDPDDDLLVIVKIRGKNKGQYWEDGTPQFKSNAGSAKRGPNPDYIVLPKSQADRPFRAAKPPVKKKPPPKAGTEPKSGIEPRVINGRQAESIGAGRRVAGREPGSKSPPHPITARTTRQPGKGRKSQDLEMKKADPAAAHAFPRTIGADVKQAQGYNKLLDSGEYGILRPGNISTGGVDAITAQVQGGKAKIFLNDFTTPGTAKAPMKKTHLRWRLELDAAVKGERLDFGNKKINDAIRKAIEDGEIYVRTVRVTLPAVATPGPRPGAGTLEADVVLGAPVKLAP